MAEIFAGATEAKRLSLYEFVKEKARKLDDNHTNLMLKMIQMEKDLANLKEQVLMHEGAVTYLNRIINEWAVYDADTVKLREAELKSRLEQKAQQEKNKKKTSKRKTNECPEQQSEQSK